jgi:hypothetical protein
MGLHQDRDESDFSAPVVSISLGDACLFRIGGTERGSRPDRSGWKAATWSFWAVKAGWLSMASTGSTRRPRPCSGMAGAST